MSTERERPLGRLKNRRAGWNGPAFRALRRRADVGPKEAAGWIGVTKAALCLWERETHYPGVRYRQAIERARSILVERAKALEVPAA